MMHSSPQLKPSGYTACIGESSGNGAFWMLRGMPNMTVWPVLASTLTTWMLSGRSPTRPAPASPPISRKL